MGVRSRDGLATPAGSEIEEAASYLLSTEMPRGPMVQSRPLPPIEDHETNMYEMPRELGPPECEREYVNIR